jgi:hypothetical protein
MPQMNCEENINYFQPTGFRVILDRRFYSHLQFYVARINHPGAQNAANDTAFKRTSVPFPGNTMTYGELTMDVLLDEDFESYKEMYDWMLRLCNEEQIAQRVDFKSSQDPIPTYADIHVTALTHANNKNVEFRYKDCVPVSIGDVNFDAQNQGVDFITFPASFRFSYFEIV